MQKIVVRPHSHNHRHTLGKHPHKHILCYFRPVDVFNFEAVPSSLILLQLANLLLSWFVEVKNKIGNGAVWVDLCVI